MGTGLLSPGSVCYGNAGITLIPLHDVLHKVEWTESFASIWSLCSRAHRTQAWLGSSKPDANDRLSRAHEATALIKYAREEEGGHPGPVASGGTSPSVAHFARAHSALLGAPEELQLARLRH